MVNYSTFPLIFPFQFGESIPPTEDVVSSATFRIAYGATELNIQMPDSLMESTTKSVQNLVFNDGTDAQLPRGKTGDSLTLSGTEISSPTAIMNSLNNFMDNRYIVAVSNLPDTNLNTDYRISNLDFSQEAGLPDIYHYNITLERTTDRLG